MAAAVVAWLENTGWDVYQEVQGRGGVADIVAVKDGVLRVVECKLTFSFASLAQAIGWKQGAEEICIAVPDYGSYHRMPDGWGLGFRFAKEEGIGVIHVRGGEDSRVLEYSAPDRQRCWPSTLQQLRDSLRPQHKTFAKAGSPTGRRFTPFKETCQNLLAFVTAHPGCTLKEAALGSKHHYSTPGAFSNNVLKLVLRDVIPGVKVRHDTTSRTYSLYPTAPPAALPAPGPGAGSPAPRRSLRSLVRVVRAG